MHLAIIGLTEILSLTSEGLEENRRDSDVLIFEVQWSSVSCLDAR